MSMDLSHVTFTVPSSTEILGTLSKVEITNPTTTVTFGQNGSLYDTRMGAFRNIPCGTCGGDSVNCSSHFGHITMSLPVINPSFFKTTFKQVISTFPMCCFKKNCMCDCVEDDREPKKKKRKVEKEKWFIKTSVDCDYTGLRFRLENSKTGALITIEECFHLIKQIKPVDYLEVFPHLTHIKCLTEALFIRYLLVLPISSRPPNQNDGMWTYESMSRLYVSVIKANIELNLRKDNVHSGLRDEYHKILQNAVNILFDINNTASKLRQNTTQNGGIRQRIDGKEGYLRKNLMGKRVEFSARTVLSGDPMLGMNEIGIPVSVAENLTIPVVVNKYNVHVIQKYNCKYLIKQGSKERFDLSGNHNVLIEIGDTVERSLINGDVVAVNRQPTLHRGSVLACYIRIFKCSTFRLNYSSMLTLNADNDGDEINIHVPQDLASRVELEELMLSSTNIVCSQSNKPLVGLTLDHLVGCFLMSQEIIHANDFMHIVFQMRLDDDMQTPDFVKNNQGFYYGTRLITKALEAIGADIKRYEPHDDFLIINNQVIKGVFDKKILGVSDNSIIHHIFLMYGHLKAAKFIHLMQIAGTAFLDIHGFSVGVGDCVVDHVPLHFDKLDEHLRKDFLKRGGKWTDDDENNLMSSLGQLTKLQIPTRVKDNRLVDMIKSGAKGSILNFNQITRMVGQQTAENGRVTKVFNERTLPHYSKYTTDIESRGLVKNSFIKGLTPQEFFFHAMGGRLGIIDTSCKTATTGWGFRKMVKTLEPLVVKDIGNGERPVIDNSTKKIVQFNYGEDNFDGTYLKINKN